VDGFGNVDGLNTLALSQIRNRPATEAGTTATAVVAEEVPPLSLRLRDPR